MNISDNRYKTSAVELQQGYNVAKKQLKALDLPCGRW